MSTHAHALKNKDSRQQDRFSINCSVLIIHGGDEQKCTASSMRNLSMSGAMLEFSEDPQLAMGQPLELTFAIPNLDDILEIDEALLMPAEVRWIKSAGNNFTVGVQFMRGFRAKEVLALQQLFRQLEKLADQDS